MPLGPDDDKRERILTVDPAKPDSESTALVARVVVGPDALGLIRAGISTLAVAQAYEFDSQEIAESAAAELRTIAALRTRIEDMRGSITAPARLIIENARGMFKPALEHLDRAELFLKDGLKGWTKLLEDRAALVRRQNEENERKARAEAEAQAAALRAAAEERSKAELAKAAAAQAAMEVAQAAGKKSEVARLAAQAASATQRAENAVAAGEAAAQDAVLEAGAATVVMPTVATKVAGFTTRERWVAQFQTGIGAAQAIRLIARELQSRPELVAYLSLDESALNKTAGAQKSAFNVPGFVAVNDPVAARARSK